MDNLPDIQTLYQLKYLNGHRDIAQDHLGNLIQKAKHFQKKMINNHDNNHYKKLQFAKISKQVSSQPAPQHPVFIVRQKQQPSHIPSSNHLRHLSQASNNNPIKNEYLRKIFKLSIPEMIELQHKMGGSKNIHYLLNTFYERKHKLKRSNQLSQKQQLNYINDSKMHHYNHNNSLGKNQNFNNIYGNHHGDKEMLINKDRSEQKPKDYLKGHSQSFHNTSKTFYNNINHIKRNNIITRNTQNVWHPPRYIEDDEFKHHLFHQSQNLERSSSMNVHYNQPNKYGKKNNHNHNSFKERQNKDKELAPWSVIDLESST